MQKPVSQTDNLFNLNFSEDEKIGLTSQETLRRVVGVLGMLLPVLLWVFVFVDNGHAEPLDSISHYYFTRVGSIFCVVVSLLAIFLMIYKGKEPMDFYLSFTAGIFAFFVILFPTDNITQLCCDADKSYSVTQLKISSFRTTFHYISAAVFLLCLAIMSIFVFTKSNKVPAAMTRNKRKRNLIFHICGWLMIAALVTIFTAGFLGWMPDDLYNKYHITFWMETLAIEAFGISWLVKGKMFIKD